MTYDEFMRDFDGAPYDVIEVAQIASRIEDNEEIKELAENLCNAQDNFLGFLEKNNYEFG